VQVEHLISIANSGTGATDADRVVVIDNGPADANVTSFRVRPGGAFAAARSFTLRVRYIVEERSRT
jgi:hypothetical protein